MAGIWLDWMERLKVSVRYCMPFRPICIKCSVEILSWPSTLDGLEILIASCVCSGVKCCALSSLFFFMFLFVMHAVLELL